MNKFQSLLFNIWDLNNACLIESIQSAYSVIFEAKLLPELTPQKGTNLDYHEYTSKETGGNKI